MVGPLTFRLAGEIADGVYAACSFSREALAFILENVKLGAARVGRDLADLDVCASVTCAVADDREAARRAARLKAAFSLPSMPPALVERHGIPFGRIQPINEAFARGDVAEALRRTPDELADRFCIAGTPEEVAERIRRDILGAGFEQTACCRSSPVDRRCRRLATLTRCPRSCCMPSPPRTPTCSRPPAFSPATRSAA